VALGALAVAEGLLRAVAPLHMVGVQGSYIYDPDLGYRLAPGIHQFQLTDHLDEVYTNALGSVNFQERFDGYETLVFAAGDSFTQGTGNPPDTTYPFQLDLLLNQDERGFYRERVGVVNLGLAAFGTEQSLIALRRYGDLLSKPDFVLYLGSDNDWDDDVLLRSGYRHQHLVAGSPHWGRLVGLLQWVSEFELAKRAKLAIGEMRRARLVTDAASPDAGANDTVPVAERVWPTIEEIVALSREWDAVLVLGWANPESSSYAWLKNKAAEQHIRFADWAPAADSVRQNMPGLSLENPHSAGHWRPWANNVIARSYAQAMGLAPQPAPAAPAIAQEDR
jgi:hypothetical protein